MTEINRFRVGDNPGIWGLNNLVDFLPGGIMTEIGSYSGESSIIFATKFDKVYCIDPWDDNICIMDNIPMDQIESSFDERCSKFDNIFKIKGTGNSSVNQFENKSLDFVYIDADHSYSAVLQDINTWIPKIKDGGYIGGHDYGLGFGVEKAVDEKFGIPDEIFVDGCWIKRLEYCSGVLVDPLVKSVISNTELMKSGMTSEYYISKILQEIFLVYKLQSTYNDLYFVELGCNCGTTSIFIQTLLQKLGVFNRFHVYDSFQGLPDKIVDKDGESQLYFKGSCSTCKEEFIGVFSRNNTTLPIIHEGWFIKIPDVEYPNNIALAFLDGDFYSSIYDSLTKVYHKIIPGGKLLIHDYNSEFLPGVTKACEDFFGKERLTKMLVDEKNKLAIITKPLNEEPF